MLGKFCLCTVGVINQGNLKVEFNVFISYSTHDLHQVKAVQAQMQNTPLRVFVAEHSVTASQQLAPSIDEAIQGCDLFIVLWSNSAKDSEWVSQEIGKATALRKKILPLVLDEDLSLPGFISDLKYIPVYKNVEGALQEASRIAEDEYQKKLAAEQSLAAQKQKEKDNLVIMGLGALFLWAITQK